jgi:hypothetical protein
MEEQMRNVMVWLTTVTALAACNGSTDTDTDIDTDTDTDTAPDYHPLVPEEYRYLWNTEGCETDDGPGASVYRYAVDGVSDGENFSITEQWFWFFPETGWDADCVDTFEMSGNLARFDLGLLGCSACEEAYEVKRVLTTSNCNIMYSSLFNFDDPVELTEFDSVLLFDSFTPNGNPNEENKMLVIGATQTDSGAYSVDVNYARGHALGEEEGYFPPAAATYDWVGDACIIMK